MTAPWWPEGAPYPQHPTGELATFELSALIEFAEARVAGSPDAGRLGEFLGALRAEERERAGVAFGEIPALPW